MAARPLGHFDTVSGLNLVCLNDAVAIAVGDNATDVAIVVEAGGAGRHVPLNEEYIEAFDVLTANGVDAPVTDAPITAVFRTTAEADGVLGPLSWFIHHLPKPLHRVEVTGNHFAHCLPRRGRASPRWPPG